MDKIMKLEIHGSILLVTGMILVLFGRIISWNGGLLCLVI